MTTIATVFFDTTPQCMNDIDVNQLTLTTPKSAKKAFKRTPDLAVVLFRLTAESSEAVTTLTQFIRKGLNNDRVRIIVCADSTDNEQHSNLLVDQEVDSIISNALENPDCLAPILHSELRTFKKMLHNEQRRETEIRILTALGNMSRHKYDDSECVANLQSLLEESTGAHTSQVFLSKEELEIDAAKPDTCSGDATDLGTGPWMLVQAAASHKTQQLCIDDAAEDHKRSSLDTAASIALPLQCYDKTIAVLHFLLPKDSLEALTVEFVDLLGKLAEQIRILFERRASEGELETQYERVKTALTKLETTQMKLYQSEKLASVGQLAAGIAHEINNPITFLAGNMRPLEEYTGAMSSMLEIHQSLIDEIDDSTPELRDFADTKIAPKAEELDIAFVMEDVRSLVNESKEGLQRVSDIVQNLTRFARKDSVEYTPASLESGLDDTIRVLSAQIDESIEIQRDYCDLPDVICSHGMVNQVFLNLIRNAAQAIASSGLIRIKTEAIELADGTKGARVSIIDNGGGIPDDCKDRIFEPFFTTKPTGQGTGLGLSMCYDIIDRHGGELAFTSVPGEGTEFRVDLPFEPISSADEEQKVA